MVKTITITLGTRRYNVTVDRYSTVTLIERYGRLKLVVRHGGGFWRMNAPQRDQAEQEAKRIKETIEQCK